MSFYIAKQTHKHRKLVLARGCMFIKTSKIIVMSRYVMRCRLQLRRGLFWFQHYPEFAPNSQISEFTGWFLDQFSPNFIARLFNLKRCKNDNIVKQIQNCCFSWENIFEKQHASYQSWKNKWFDIIYLNLINLIIHNQID